MIEPWVLWIPVIAAAVGGSIGAGASLATAIVTARIQANQQRDARRNAQIDAAELALKEVGRQMLEQVVKPGWWPTIGLLRPPRDFAYDVVRVVPDEKATADWTNAAQEVLVANTSLWRLWAWHLVRIGAQDRERMAARVLAAELGMMEAAEQSRPNRKRRAATPESGA